jgi:HSP20 family protein
MNLTPWRKKHTIPVTHEMTASTPNPLACRRELDQLFERFLRGSWEWPPALGWTAAPMPALDVSESDKRITIRAEVPGVTPDDFEITISGNMLTIRGEKSASSEEEGDDFHHSERCFGSFTRRIELPTSADPDAIEADECNGVLTIRVKKLPAAQSKKVEVKGVVPERELVGAAN